MGDSYSLEADGYPKRAQALFDRGDDACLLYAGLEIRLGVEARMREYIDQIEHIPAREKKHWEVAKLRRSLSNAYRTGDKAMVWTITFASDGAELTLFYTPVVGRLQTIAEKLSAYLHFPRKIEDDFWPRLRSLVSEALPLLFFANAGDLVGLPLFNKRTGKITTLSRFQSGDQRLPLAGRVKAGEDCLVNVTYIEPNLDSIRHHPKRVKLEATPPSDIRNTVSPDPQG